MGKFHATLLFAALSGMSVIAQSKFDAGASRYIGQAEENMKVSGKQYEVGLETLSDYLEAQMLWQQAYQTRVDAHFQLYVNYIAYLKAAGQLQ